jgi:hypothetical protein
MMPCRQETCRTRTRQVNHDFCPGCRRAQRQAESDRHMQDVAIAEAGREAAGPFNQCGADRPDYDCDPSCG